MPKSIASAMAIPRLTIASWLATRAPRWEADEVSETQIGMEEVIKPVAAPATILPTIS
jgi:hypothetical protein